MKTKTAAEKISSNSRIIILLFSAYFIGLALILPIFFILDEAAGIFNAILYTAWLVPLLFFVASVTEFIKVDEKCIRKGVRGRVEWRNIDALVIHGLPFSNALDFMILYENGKELRLALIFVPDKKYFSTLVESRLGWASCRSDLKGMIQRKIG